jgi:hypothetical protein
VTSLSGGTGPFLASIFDQKKSVIFNLFVSPFEFYLASPDYHHRHCSVFLDELIFLEIGECDNTKIEDFLAPRQYILRAGVGTTVYHLSAQGSTMIPPTANLNLDVEAISGICGYVLDRVILQWHQ